MNMENKGTFQSVGNTPDDKDYLNRIDRGKASCSQQWKRILLGILSGPALNFTSSFLR